MQSTARSITRLQRLLKGETVEGLRLGDPGLNRDWVTWHLAQLRQIQRDRPERIAARRQAAGKQTNFTPQSVPADGGKVSVLVGWVEKPDLGALDCEVVERWPNGGAKIVRWANGEPQRVVYCHSQRRYVFLNSQLPA